MDNDALIQQLDAELEKVLGLGSTQQGLVLKDLADGTFRRIGLREIQRRFRELQITQRKNTKSESDRGEPAGTPVEIETSDSLPRGTVFFILLRLMISLGAFYRHGGRLTRIANNEISIIKKHDELNGALVGLCEFYCFDKDVNKKYALLEKEHGNAFLGSPLLTHFPVVDYFTNSPALNADFEALPKGYDAESRIYCNAESIEPIAGINTIIDLLYGFCFKSNADRTNFVAALLTGPIHHQFPGGIPLFSIDGNQPNVGKDELSQVLAIVRDGVFAQTLSLNHDVVETEKRVCSALMCGARVILFSNVKTSHHMPEIASPLVERMITDPEPSFRILGTNRTFRIPNNILVIINKNGGAMCKDFISRQVVCALHYDGDPVEREYKHDDIKQFALDNRTQILAEILAMYKRWVEAGMPRVKSKHRMRKWAEVIGGVLEVNGFKDFLENASETALSDNPAFLAVLDLLKILEHSQKYSATDLLRMAKAKGLFADQLPGPMNDAMAAAFGKIMAQFINRKLCFENQKVFFKMKRTHNVAAYWVESVDQEKDPSPPTKVIHLSELNPKVETVEVSANNLIKEKISQNVDIPKQEGAAVPTPSTIGAVDV